ncbi:unnamed protein product, partial [Rotaria magnacalcarata]
KVQGKNFPFSFGGILMGAIDNWFDERRVTGNAPPDRHGTKGKKKGACCIL